MVQFTEFELKNSEIIYGGDLLRSVIIYTDGSTQPDMYDTERERIIFL